MDYFMSKIVNGDFIEVMERVVALLRDEGFGIKTEIDMDGTFKEKLDVDFKRYHILGACNPKVAYQAVQAEDKVGVFLPCNVVLIEQEVGVIEVATVNVTHMMQGIGNPVLTQVSSEIDASLRRVLDAV